MTEGLDFYSANGALAGIEVLDVDAMRLVHRLEIAGDAFYQGLADRIGNDEAAELLRRNGREELGHQRWAELEPDPEVARLLRQNGREETQHGKRVEQVMAILGAGGE